MEHMGSVPRLPERGEEKSRLVVKHDLVSSSSVTLGLIFDDAPYFSFCAPFRLFKRHKVTGRPAITVTDGFPGGRSAVAKIPGVGVGMGWVAVHVSSNCRCE